MIEFMNNFNWLLEGAVTAFLIFFLAIYFDRRNVKRHYLNLVATLAVEMRDNYKGLIKAWRKTFYGNR